MNLQVQVTASLCLVLLVIQPALSQPNKSFKELSYDETEHERAHANIRIVEREVIKKSPTCDCHSKITKLPAVTIHQAGARTFDQPIDDVDFPTSHRHADEDSDEVGEQLRRLYGKNVPSFDKPVINRRLVRLQQSDIEDDDDLPAHLRQLYQNDEKLNGKELLLRKLYEKYGDDLPSLGPQPRQPVINRRLARLQQSDIEDDDDLPAHLRQLYQNDEKLNGKELLLRKLYEKYGDDLPSLGPQPRQPVINRRLARLQKIRELDFDADADEQPAHLRRLYKNDEKLNGEELLLRKLCEKYEYNLPGCRSKLPRQPVFKW